MKRYNWEYNGETMGLIERERGICVLHSEHTEVVASLQAEVQELHGMLGAITQQRVRMVGELMPEAMRFVGEDYEIEIKRLNDALESIGKGWNRDASLLAEEARLAVKKGSK
jgi:hypothetical protein